MNKVILIIKRILAFIPVSIIMLIHLLGIWILMMKDFIIYGGESVIYNKKMNRKTLVDIFNKLDNIK
jgi:hypothetical protein